MSCKLLNFITTLDHKRCSQLLLISLIADFGPIWLWLMSLRFGLAMC